MFFNACLLIFYFPRSSLLSVHQEGCEWLPGIEAAAGHVQGRGQGAEGQGAADGGREEGASGGGGAQGTSEECCLHGSPVFPHPSLFALFSLPVLQFVFILQSCVSYQQTFTFRFYLPLFTLPFLPPQVKKLQESKREERKKLADEEAIRKIKQLEESVHQLQRQVAVQKQVKAYTQSTENVYIFLFILKHHFFPD